jgi:hypothetical protein
MIDAQEAVQKALELAKLANIPILFTRVEKISKENNTWIIVLRTILSDEKYVIKVDAETGRCLSLESLRDEGVSYEGHG